MLYVSLIYVHILVLPLQQSVASFPESVRPSPKRQVIEVPPVTLAIPSKNNKEQEKLRLQELEEKLRLTIQQHKEDQAKKKHTSKHSKDPNSDKKKRRKDSERPMPLLLEPERVITQETMAIGSGSEEVGMIESIKERKKMRRRSSLKNSVLTSPLVRHEKEKQESSEEEKKEEEVEKNDEEFTFTMPSPAQLQNIVKLHVSMI